jgi:hypothetical protein
MFSIGQYNGRACECFPLDSTMAGPVNVLHWTVQWQGLCMFSIGQYNGRACECSPLYSTMAGPVNVRSYLTTS